MDTLLRKEVLRHHITIMLTQAKVAMGSNFACALVLVVALWGRVPASRLGLWFLALVVISALRIALHRGISGRLAVAETIAEVERERRLVTVLLLLSGLVWGVAGLGLVPGGRPQELFVVALVLAGLSSGAVTSYATLPEAAVGFIVATLTPFWVRLYFDAVPLHLAIMSLVIIYELFMVSLTRRLSTSFTEAVVMRFQIAAINQELTKAKGNLVEAVQMAALGEIAANLAHELNNPMAIVYGRIEQIRDALSENDRLPPGTLARQLDSIEGALSRVHKTIQSFVAFSGRAATSAERVGARSVIEDAVTSLSTKYTEARAHLRLSLPPESVTVPGDRSLLAHSLYSLLLNAWEATAKASDRRIRVHGFFEGGRLCIDVSDNGEGIPGAVRDRIFEPFFTTKNGGKGTGLGLTFARNIVIRHDGKLELLETGEGTTFRITLPKAA